MVVKWLPSTTVPGGIADPVLSGNAVSAIMFGSAANAFDERVLLCERAQSDATRGIVIGRHPDFGVSELIESRSRCPRGCAGKKHYSSLRSVCGLVIRVVVGIEFSDAVRAQSVREFRLGVGLNVTLQGLPGLVLIPNSFARSTDG